jgi:hypothetical protein
VRKTLLSEGLLSICAFGKHQLFFLDKKGHTSRANFIQELHCTIRYDSVLNLATVLDTAFSNEARHHSFTKVQGHNVLTFAAEVAIAVGLADHVEVGALLSALHDKVLC